MKSETMQKRRGSVSEPQGKDLQPRAATRPAGRGLPKGGGAEGTWRRSERRKCEQRKGNPFHFFPSLHGESFPVRQFGIRPFEQLLFEILYNPKSGTVKLQTY